MKSENLTFSYETAPNVINGISFGVSAQERIVFLGGNGEGKSTLFYLLAGLYPPASGKIFLEGEEVDTTREMPAHQRRKIGFLFQEAEDQILGATVYEDISFGPMNLALPEEEVHRRVQEVIRLTGLEGLENHPTHYLSGGQKKRLSLASTLVMEPKVLLCDEPFNSLDNEMKQKVEEYLWNYSLEGHAVVLASHDVDLAWRFATRVVLIEKGKILLDAKPEEFFRETEILKQTKLPTPFLIELSEKLGIKRWLKTIEEANLKDNKKATVLVHFGTTFDEARERTMDVLEKEMVEAYPQRVIKSAFTSEMVRGSLRRRDIHIPNVAEVLEDLKNLGVREVHLLVSLLLDGKEYQKVKEQASKFADVFDELKITQPLIHENSMDELAEILMAIYPQTENHLTLFMGHGTSFASDEMYRRLEESLNERGYPSRIATIEGREGLEDVLSRLPIEKEKKIHLVPLLYVAGDHATHDMVENTDSWKHKLESQGYLVKAQIIGLGEHEEIRELYRKNLEEIA